MSALDEHYGLDSSFVDIPNEVSYDGPRGAEWNDTDHCWVCGKEPKYQYLVCSNDPYFEAACEQHNSYTHFDTQLYRRHLIKI